MSNIINKGSKGFTLIELLVVIAIIGILSSVVLASLSTARAKSRDARRISDIGQIQLALELYFDSSSSYPVAGTNAATADPTITGLAPTYIPKIPVDPLATQHYLYGASSTTYVLGAKLERYDNPALNSDADTTTFSGFNGLTANCAAGTSLTGQPQGGAAGETCYDIVP
jgi:prepilin-type N-terminal cleavage/methylation domain-containing protein